MVKIVNGEVVDENAPPPPPSLASFGALTPEPLTLNPKPSNPNAKPRTLCCKPGARMNAFSHYTIGGWLLLACVSFVLAGFRGDCPPPPIPQPSPVPVRTAPFHPSLNQFPPRSVSHCSGQYPGRHMCSATPNARPSADRSPCPAGIIAVAAFIAVGRVILHPPSGLPSLSLPASLSSLSSGSSSGGGGGGGGPGRPAGGRPNIRGVGDLPARPRG